MEQLARPTFRLVAGLGNPGPEYARTRHNIGFMALERLAAGAGADFRLEKAWQAEIARGSGVIFCRPTTYMNRSGEAVAAVMNYYKITPQETLVMLDDAALPLGKIRLRATGSAGGHNGLQSVIACVGGEGIPRLRIGIGAAQHSAGMVDHVLGVFTSEEMPAVEESLDRAVSAVEVAQERGLQFAMNQFNQ